jgi:hypothetical protein
VIIVLKQTKNKRVEEKGGGNTWQKRDLHRSRSSTSSGKLRSTSTRAFLLPKPSRKIGVTEQTYYRWRKEYGGIRVEQAKRLKELEKENVRLKKLVADLSLDNSLLK